MKLLRLLCLVKGKQGLILLDKSDKKGFCATLRKWKHLHLSFAIIIIKLYFISFFISNKCNIAIDNQIYFKLLLDQHQIISNPCSNQVSEVEVTWNQVGYNV